VVTVEKALDTYGGPIYVRKQIVHNRHVVEDLEKRGAIFVDELAQVPPGSTVVFSAHGVSPAVHAEARDRGLRTIDATCPLVTKVHQEARRFARDDRWHSLARLAIREDIYGSLRSLCSDVLAGGEPEESGEEKIEEWEATNSARVARARRTLTEIYEDEVHDLATLSVAARQIRSMTRTTGTGSSG
jgi:4-hydroxy-3-methylbut-2-enyl diphosphate reductase